MRRRTALLAATSVLLGLAAVAAPPAAAGSDTVVTLPMTSFRDIVVDEAHGYVFVSGGGSTGVVVRTLSGAAVTTIADQPGASGMALSPDGTRLYVALAQGDAVSAIDTTTLAQVARYETGAETCPGSVATYGDLVWFGYGCGTWDGNIGVVDLSGETPAVTLGRVPDSTLYLTYAAPLIEVTPDGTRMLAAARGLSPSYLYTMNVSGTTITANASRDVGGNLGDLAVSDDGLRVVTASGSPYHHPRFRTSDLAGDGVFGDAMPYPNAVDLSGSYVAAGTNGIYDPDVRVYRDTGQLLRTFDLGRNLMSHGLALTASGTVYAVVGTYEGEFFLHVLRDTTKLAASVVVSQPAPGAKIDTAFTVSGHLSPGPAGTVLRVKRASKHGTVALADVTTTDDGTFSFTDTVAKRGTYTYTVTFDGDDTYAAASGSASVVVTGLVPSLTITTNAASYGFRATAVVTARLGGTANSRALRLTAQAYGYPTATIKTGDVDSGGYLKVGYTITRRTTFGAHFAGDDVYEPRTVGITRGALAGLSSSLAGWYATSGSYRLYRRTANPVINVYVQPNRAGTCTSYIAQQYVSGAWRTIATNPCLRLDGSSRMAAVLTGTHPVSVPHRVRATFNGDASNLKTTGGWLYLRFT